MKKKQDLKNNRQIPIFVISLACAPERRTSICAHLDGLSLSYHIIEAVDGLSVTSPE